MYLGSPFSFPYKDTRETLSLEGVWGWVRGGCVPHGYFFSNQTAIILKSHGSPILGWFLAL